MRIPFVYLMCPYSHFNLINSILKEVLYLWMFPCYGLLERTVVWACFWFLIVCWYIKDQSIICLFFRVSSLTFLLSSYTSFLGEKLKIASLLLFEYKSFCNSKLFQLIQGKWGICQYHFTGTLSITIYKWFFYSRQHIIGELGEIRI